MTKSSLKVILQHSNGLSYYNLYNFMIETFAYFQISRYIQNLYYSIGKSVTRDIEIHIMTLSTTIFPSLALINEIYESKNISL